VLHPDTPPWMFRAILFGLVAWWVSLGVVSIAASLRSLIITLAASFIVSCALENPVARLNRLGLRRGVATVIVLLGLMGLFVGVSVAVGALVVTQITHLVTHAPATVASAVTSLNHTFGLHLKSATAVNWLSHHNLSHLSSGHSALTSKVLSTLGQVGNVLTGLLITFYLVAEGPHLRRVACSTLRPSNQAELLRAWELAVTKTSGYFTSRFLLAGLRTVSLAILLVIVHVPAWLALALWFGVIAEFVPVVGTALGTALPVAVALTVSPLVALTVLVFITVFTQVRNFVLAPKLSRRAVNVHPALAFVAVIAVARVVGPAGTLLAIPVVATVQAFAASYIHRHEIEVDSPLLVSSSKKQEQAIEDPNVPTDEDPAAQALLDWAGFSLDELSTQAATDEFVTERARLAWLALTDTDPAIPEDL